MSNTACTENLNAKTSRFGFRATPYQEAIILKAAEVSRKNVTEFILNSACLAAENVLSDQRLFFVDDASWEAFVDALERPVQLKPRLAELMKASSPWE